MRLGPVVASAPSLPAFVCGATDSAPPVVRSTSPARTAPILAGPPLYGACSSSMPVRRLNSVLIRWDGVPLPWDEYVRPGTCVLASVTRSETERALDATGTTMTLKLQ